MTRARDILGNQRGVALAMVLVIAAIALAVIGTLIYMLTSGTQISGMHKRYNTALEAATGAESIMYAVIGAREPGTVGIGGVNLSFTDPTGCFRAKIANSTVFNADPDWSGTSGWGDCDSSMAIDITNTPNATYDFSADLGDYMAFGKIVNTITGNSGASTGLVKSGVVAANSGETTSVSRPYTYGIEVEARNPNNPEERSRLSILYQY
jgi:uncharacterized protein (UPF0333 family)